MTRAAVTVFIETDHQGDAIDAAFLFRMALRRAIGGDVLNIQPHNWEPITITIHDVQETGMAAGNGYLWLEPTGKAFPRKSESEAGA